MAWPDTTLPQWITWTKTWICMNTHPLYSLNSEDGGMYIRIVGNTAHVHTVQRLKSRIKYLNLLISFLFQTHHFKTSQKTVILQPAQNCKLLCHDSERVKHHYQIPSLHGWCSEMLGRLDEKCAGLYNAFLYLLNRWKVLERTDLPMRWKRSEKYYICLESFLFTFIFSFFFANLFFYVAHYYNTLCEVKPCSSSLLKMISHLSYKYHRMF